MRILVVEDDPGVVSFLRRGLGRHGYAVDVAGTGPEAIWLEREFPYAVVVLDVNLPEGDGFDVCAQLRAEGRWVPVLILTGRGAVEDRVRGLDAGADDYLAKPFVLEELLARLRALARRGPVARPTVLAVGDLRLDPAARTVTRAGTEIELTPREFSVLHALMRRPGEVVSRQDLVDEVWDFSYEAGSNVVDVYIGYLRRKVDRPFETEMIETVRGVGYRLAEPA
jgi:two-component system, OmpR family, response regulator